MKTQSMTIKDFMSGEYKQKDRIQQVRRFGKALTISAGSLAIVLPADVYAAAAETGTFDKLHVTIMNIFDSGVVLVIIFAGAIWALGHRTRAIEILLGVCIGYILARHAVDIRDYLKLL